MGCNKTSRKVYTLDKGVHKRQLVIIVVRHCLLLGTARNFALCTEHFGFCQKTLDCARTLWIVLEHFGVCPNSWEIVKHCMPWPGQGSGTTRLQQRQHDRNINTPRDRWNSRCNRDSNIATSTCNTDNMTATSTLPGTREVLRHVPQEGLDAATFLRMLSPPKHCKCSSEVTTPALAMPYIVTSGVVTSLNLPLHSVTWSIPSHSMHCSWIMLDIVTFKVVTSHMVGILPQHALRPDNVAGSGQPQ